MNFSSPTIIKLEIHNSSLFLKPLYNNLKQFIDVLVRSVIALFTQTVSMIRINGWRTTMAVLTTANVPISLYYILVLLQFCDTGYVICGLVQHMTSHCPLSHLSSPAHYVTAALTARAHDHRRGSYLFLYKVTYKSITPCTSLRQDNTLSCCKFRTTGTKVMLSLFVPFLDFILSLLAGFVTKTAS